MKRRGIVLGLICVILMSGCTKNMTGNPVGGNVSDTSTDKAIKVVWSNIYYWAMGSDYVYIDSDGYIYAEHEMEEPLFSPLGACDETYTGKKFTEEEFNAFLELKYDDEVAQKEVLSKKGIKFGK